jgi:hypothetical protein
VSKVSACPVNHCITDTTAALGVGVLFIPNSTCCAYKGLQVDSNCSCLSQSIKPDLAMVLPQTSPLATPGTRAADQLAYQPLWRLQQRHAAVNSTRYTTTAPSPWRQTSPLCTACSVQCSTICHLLGGQPSGPAAQLHVPGTCPARCCTTAVQEVPRPAAILGCLPSWQLPYLESS